MITKTLIGLSALISAGYVVGADHAVRAVEAPAVFAARFPSFEELMLQPAELKRVAVLPAGVPSAAPARAATPAAPAVSAAKPLAKGDRLPVSRPAGCESQTWPYIASDCLTSIDGSPVRRPVRTITIERNLGDGSILVTAGLADMVAR